MLVISRRIVEKEMALIGFLMEGNGLDNGLTIYKMDLGLTCCPADRLLRVFGFKE